MKTSILLLFAIMLTSLANAQILGGFFSQKQENRKRLAEQIAALQVYKTYAQKGYTIVSTGLKTINNIKNGDLGLHRDFFGALNHVNPRIKKYSKVADLIAMNVRTLQYQKQIKYWSRSEVFSSEENQYIQRVLVRVLEGVSQTVDKLLAILADNQLELKDDERINRIDKLYTEMQDQYHFIRSFGNDVGTMSANRYKALHGIRHSEILNDLN